MSALDLLMDMGFPRDRAEKALAITGNKGVEAAMEWLLSHPEDAGTDEPQGYRLTDAPSSESTAAEGTGGSGGEAAAPGGVAASLKCDECGKLLKDADAVQYHAAKSGHSQFSESTEAIKPLTEEEKAEQRARLQQRLVEKRLMRQEEEKKQAIEAEKIRRKSGRDLSSAKDNFDRQRKLQDAENRKREMLEAKRAKEEIMAKVAADKAARQAAKAKPAAQASTQPPAQTASTVGGAPPEKKQYTDCKVRVRLPDGKAVMHTFAPTDKLSAVVTFVRSHYAEGSFSLKMAMPPKTFQGTDMDKTLQDLNLMPSANLMVIKS